MCSVDELPQQNILCLEPKWLRSNLLHDKMACMFNRLIEVYLAGEADGMCACAIGTGQSGIATARRHKEASVRAR